jgi:Na+/proline symporter
MPPLFNFKITVRSFWISLLTGSFISIYLMPPGFHSIAVDSQPVNAFITFPNQGVVMFWVMIVVLNVMNGLHRSINLTRLTAVKENLADKRDDVLDELLTPIKRRLKDINYFL